MKKFFVLAAVAATVAFTSCNGGSAKLNSDADSLAYELGVGQSDGLKQYMSMQLGVDSAYLDEFIKGMKEGALNDADPKKEAYMRGLEVGKQVQGMAKNLTTQVYADDSTQNISPASILAGLVDGLKGKADKTSDQAMASFNDRLEPLREAALEKQYGDNKKAGEDYLAKNAKAEGVTTLPSGVQYKVITPGDGPMPTDSTVVKCNYEGKLIDGTVFDSSYERGQAFEVNLAFPRVIQGWVEVLKLMPAGSKWEVTIPYAQAYGTQDMGKIKPFSTLIFTIETLK